MSNFKFEATEPGVPYEYRVVMGTLLIGRVRKAEAKEYPFALTGKWNAYGVNAWGGFPTRRAAAEWLASWVWPDKTK